MVTYDSYAAVDVYSDDTLDLLFFGLFSNVCSLMPVVMLLVLSTLLSGRMDYLKQHLASDLLNRDELPMDHLERLHTLISTPNR